MTREEIAALAAKLAPDLESIREERLHRSRGGPRRQNTAEHKRPVLEAQDMVLLAVLYLRHVCSQTVLAEMIGLNQRTLGPAIKHVRQLLRDRGLPIAPTTLCFSSGQQLEDYLQTGALTSPRQQLSRALADPRLTGLSRTDLDALIDRLSVRQAALIEGRRHRQRGGPRQPGTRGGVFRQKITDAERLLAAILYQRRIGTAPVLAAAFGVSTHTFWNALTDARPILEEAQISLPASERRFTTTAELLAFAETPDPNSCSLDTPTG